MAAVPIAASAYGFISFFRFAGAEARAPPIPVLICRFQPSPENSALGSPARKMTLPSPVPGHRRRI